MLVGHKLNKETEIVVAVREEGDEPLHSDAGFFFQLRNALQNEHVDTVKSLMEKDGLLEPSDKYHLRSADGDWDISDPRHITRPTYVHYNEKGFVSLDLQCQHENVTLPIIGSAYKMLFPEGIERVED